MSIAWAKQGIVGRGVLIDFVSYAERKKIKYSPLEYYSVPLEVAKEIASECRFDFQAGDIIFLRTGTYHIRRRISKYMTENIPRFHYRL